MENQTLPTAQPSYEITPDTTSVSEPSKYWIKPILLSLIGILIAGGLVYAGVQIGKNQTPNQQSVVAQPTATPSELATNPTAMPSPATVIPADDPTTEPKNTSPDSLANTTIPTQDWKQHSEDFFAFRYPETWTKDANDGKLTTPNPALIAYIVSPGEPLMNECMKIIKQTLTSNGVLVTYFSHIQGVESCSNPETWNEREIWISDTSDDAVGAPKRGPDGNYLNEAPGLMISYVEENADQVGSVAESIALTMQIAP